MSRPLSHHVLRDHVLIGAAAALVFARSWGSQAGVLFWLANILIDGDHYLHFLIYNGLRDWTPGAMMRFHQALFVQAAREDFLAIEAFHTAEFVALAACAAWRWPWLRPIFWGGLFHIVVDFVHLALHGIFAKRANSFLEFWLRCRRLKTRGLNPLWLYRKKP